MDSQRNKTMIKDLQRIIRKGHGDALVNLKIKEFHKEAFDFKNRASRLAYDIVCEKIDIIELANLEAEEGEEEEVPVALSDEKDQLEADNAWLLILNDDGGISLPEFSMSDEEVEDFRVENYADLRSAAYEAKKQFELIADGEFDAHIAEVKSRFPKA